MHMTTQRRVLIVEDEASVRKIIRDGLEKHGMVVDEAENGKVALNKAGQVHPQVVILDFLMPKMHGLEFFQLLRQEEWGRSIKIIILTNLPDDPRLVQLQDQGLCKVLSKAHASLDDIITTVRESESFS